MEIDHLKSFLEVAKLKHFSLAAQELYISQSSLSKQIKSLEKEIGTILFNRSTRQVELTAAGQELKDYAHNIVSIYNSLISKMDFYSNDNSKSILYIGSIAVANQYELPLLMSFFQNKYPNIKIRFVEDNFKNLITLLNESKLHALFITSHSLQDDYYRKYPLVFDELCLVVSKKHKLASENIIDIYDVFNEDFLLLEKSAIYDLTISMFKEKGYLPNINTDSRKIETVISLVSENLGVTIVTRKVASWFNSSKLKIIKIKNSSLVTTVLAINDKKGNKKEIELFKDYSVEWFRGNR